MKTKKKEKATTLTENEISAILQKYEQIDQYRDSAYLTVIAETGLSPNTVKQLRIKNIEKIMEKETPIPCRVYLQGIKKMQSEVEPIFIGQKAVNTLKKHLSEQKSEELLFSVRNKPNKSIHPPEQNRRFQYHAKQALKSDKTKEQLNQISLYSLIRFYEGNARSYMKKVNENKDKNNDEYFRNLYENEVLPNLEPRTWEITKLKNRLAKTEILVEILSQAQYQQAVNLLTKPTDEVKKELTLTPQAYQRIRVDDQKTDKKPSERLLEISKMFAEAQEGKPEKLHEFRKQLNCKVDDQNGTNGLRE